MMKKKVARLNFIIVFGFAIATFLLWGWGNRPSAEPPWPSKVAGMSFSPLRLHNDPVAGDYPTEAEIAADLALLQGKVLAIRTYGLGGTLSSIPQLAEKHGMKVTLGAWLTDNLEENERELERLLSVAKNNKKNIIQVIVGNETLLRGELSVEQLAAYLDRTRKALDLPVSTGEPWNVWVANPELAPHTDFIAAHFLPYWEGVALKAALDHVDATYVMLQEAFPKKRILMAEVGWPSNGRTRGASVATHANEAIFLRNYLQRAERNHYDYYLMEAFDQPWKSESEGAVGAYWGVFDAHRNPKFPFTEPIVRVPQWRLLAGLSVGLGLAAALILFTDSSTLRRRGRSFLALLANGIAATLVWVVYDYAYQYQSLLTISVGICLLFGFLGICLVLLTEAHELAEASWMKKRRRFFAGTPERELEIASGRNFPKVSIHVPAYNEPPEMMIETLDALSRLDYPDFEVLVIDNNTSDPAVWQPVEAHCAALGERFRFFHVSPLAGFKAGALNFALQQTAADAEAIAVIDSDYQVSPRWLSDLIPYFANPEIGFVQAPQDYHDGDTSLFKKMCYAEYKGFFHIGMVTRNDRNAIIEHGTMTMVRARVLREVGGWAEWCITEDAELGLRIFEAGYEGGYIEQSYGRGVMPDTFIDYKKQRFRWAYGAVQIMRRHLGALLGWRDKRLSRGQRYHFVAGWLPWLADGLNLFYTFGALLWSMAILLDPQHTDPPLAVFTIPPLALFFFKVLKLVYLYRTRLGASRWETLGAALAGLALSHTIAKAMVAGFWTKNIPFFRTPKCENRPRLVQAVLSAAEETLLAFLLIAAALGVLWLQAGVMPGARLWAGALLVQSLPYLAALGMGVVSALPGSVQGEKIPVVSP